MHTRSITIGFVALLLPWVLCAADKADAPLAKVSGKITLDGKPLASATVTFYPEAKDGKTATGKTDDAGRYTMKTAGADGALPGKYRVTISLPPRDEKDPKPPRRAIPPRYSDKEKSELTVEIPPKGSSEFDFDLTSK
jgi:hypothetical protein